MRAYRKLRGGVGGMSTMGEVKKENNNLERAELRYA